MSNTHSFSINRTFLLMRHTIANHGKTVLWALTAILAVLLLFFTLTGLGGAFDSYRLRMSNGFENLLRDFFLPYYFTGMILFGAVVTGMAFPGFRSKGKTISYLTLPANTTEKFVAMFLLTTIGFLLLYTAGFYIFNIAAIFTGKILGGIDLRLIDYTAVSLPEVAKTFFLLHAFFLLGAATFQKVPVVFSGIIFFLLIMIAALMFPLIIDKILGTGYYPALDEIFRFTLRLDGYKTAFDMVWLNSFLSFVAAPLLWLAAFLKLKEKEV